MGVPVTPQERLRERERQNILMAYMRDWLPEHVTEHIDRVRASQNFDLDCHTIRLKFRNGVWSLPLNVQETGRVLVKPLDIIDSDEYFTYWQAQACMAAGPEIRDGGGS